MRLRGELCIGVATFLSFVAVLLVIFAHVGQINTSSVPRKISMLQVNVSGYGAALELATGDPSDGLYASNTSIPLGQASGLRESYAFGLYSYCGYVNSSLGSCSNSTTALQVQPYQVMLDDMNGRFTSLTRNFIPDLSFTNSHYTGQFTRAAYYLLLMGSIFAALAMITGIPKRTYTFLLSTMFAILGTGLLFIGCVIYTVVINKMKDVNRANVTNSETGVVTPLGITVSAGSSLWLFWASFVCLFLSITPYLVSCCTYRG
ncbi:SUR7 family [Pyrrhoderma noxium]|uniref:SUR7 family n=1 Tax=Pyrrhoderma noxium TaxID=2282107 RepID=A0A286URN2_9AGAM|nr:SUR7 family [Pyrrhoderma noxium]